MGLSWTAGAQMRPRRQGSRTCDRVIVMRACGREARPHNPGCMRKALATIVAASAAPYGYTVTLWSSGAVLMASHGTPRVAEVFAFLAGALAGFGVMALAAHGAVGRAELLDDAADRVLAGTLHVLAVGSSVGAVALLAEIQSWAAWPLSAFAATALYLLVASLQLAAVAGRRK
jgi:hypothetical protein